MTATIRVAESAINDAPAGRRRWGAAHYLAALAVPLLAYELWTLISWFASGPHQVTKGRESGTGSWWAARAIEVGASALALTMLFLVVRASRRAGRMSFDLKLWIALLLTSFWDSWTNFLQPIWFYSTQFVNLNEWWGHAPGFVSPAGGQEPFPIVALVMLYPCFVLESRLAGRMWTALRLRRPGISNVRLLLVGLVFSLTIGVGISMMFILPHLWAGPGMGQMIISTETYRYSIAEFLYVGTWSVTVCGLRFFVDSDGRRLTERGLDRLRPAMRNLVSTMATTAWCSLAVIMYSSLVTLTGLAAHRYPQHYPEHLPNVVCSIPGDAQTDGSAYGLCPGSPGFRIPLR